MKFVFKVIITVVVLVVSIFILSVAFQKIMEGFYPEKYTEYVDKYSEEYGVDKDLVYAVIKCESGYDSDAVSHADAKGLMQITKDTFEWVQTKTGEAGLKTDDLFDPEINIKYGVKLLSLHLTEFGDETAAIAAYHAGRSAVNGWLEKGEYSEGGITLDKIPYKETATYVERVLKTKDIYKNIYRKE